jgi:hypothetical protein
MHKIVNFYNKFKILCTSKSKFYYKNKIIYYISYIKYLKIHKK